MSEKSKKQDFLEEVRYEWEKLVEAVLRVVDWIAKGVEGKYVAHFVVDVVIVTGMGFANMVEANYVAEEDFLGIVNYIVQEDSKRLVHLENLKDLMIHVDPSGQESLENLMDVVLQEKEENVLKVF